MNKQLVIKHISISKHSEKIISTFEYGVFKTEFINSNGNKWFNILLCLSIQCCNTKWKYNNGTGSDGNDSMINRDKVKLIPGCPLHMLTNLYWRYQLIDKKNTNHQLFHNDENILLLLTWINNTDVWMYQGNVISLALYIGTTGAHISCLHSGKRADILECGCLLQYCLMVRHLWQVMQTCVTWSFQKIIFIF